MGEGSHVIPKDLGPEPEDYKHTNALPKGKEFSSSQTGRHLTPPRAGEESWKMVPLPRKVKESWVF